VRHRTPPNLFTFDQLRAQVKPAKRAERFSRTERDREEHAPSFFKRALKARAERILDELDLGLTRRLGGAV
jgi:hypothetical protein